MDDDPGQVRALREILGDLGLEATAFHSAESALEALDPTAPPELVLVRLCLPGLDGWQLCRLLRGDDFEAFGRAIPEA